MEQNNLELYLKEVFEKECVLKIDKEEVEFIKTGIETLVQNIVDKVLEGDTVDKLFGENFEDKERKLRDPETDECIQDYVQNSLTEVYFPISKDSYFQQYPHIKASSASIIKAGSFYEGTKNGFPDEFDFIFLYFCGTEESPNEVGPRIQTAMETCIKNTVYNDEVSLFYPSIYTEPEYLYVRSPAEHINTRRLYFDKYLQVSGPAHTLQFIYRNCGGQTRYIHADLVPAERIVVEVSKKPMSYRYLEIFLVKPKSFRKEVLSAESFVRTSGTYAISLTQTEVHFMRDVLSKKHVKVYRILKYLINGHGDGEKLKNYITGSFSMSRLVYSSYKIKTMIFDHHDECSNSDNEDLGPCVIQVLEEMCKYEDINDFPKLVPRMIHSNQVNFCLFPYLLDLTKTLKLMQSSQDTYNYEIHQIMPLSKQYIHENADVPLDVIKERLTGRLGFSNKFYGRKRFDHTWTESTSTPTVELSKAEHKHQDTQLAE